MSKFRFDLVRVFKSIVLEVQRVKCKYQDVGEHGKSAMDVICNIEIDVKTSKLNKKK
ncbi:MAG: hypothetical protein HQK73_07460 [Desulfamplus sp.]|nr:hypothetical protein [Desulfamplus sp.]